MGFMTLTDFRLSVGFVLGSPAGLPASMVDIWINQGYFELCRRRRFDALLAPQTATTVDGTREYLLSTRTYSIGWIRDLSSKKLLRQTTPKLINQADRTVAEKPTQYASLANKFWLDPTPNGAYDLEVWAYQEPNPMSTPQQVTVLASYADVMVEAFARYYALMSSGRTQEAYPWLIKAKEMLKEAPDDESQRYLDNDHLGANVAYGVDDFEDAQ